MVTTMRLPDMTAYEALRNRDTRKVVAESQVKLVHLCDASRKPNPRGQHRPGEMNKNETAFSMHLEIRKAAKEVKDWKFEAIKLKLADNTYFIPDFNVEMTNGDLVMVEVKRLWKGKAKPHYEDDAKVKVKVAADLFRGWFTFYGAHWDGAQWCYEGF